jgi:serine/threonine protein kinase
VAVKLLTYVTRSPDRDDLGLLAAFEEEVFMLAQLRHPNICLFLGVCLESPQRAIVTELVPRGSLWDALRECQLFQKVRSVLCCACDMACSLFLFSHPSLAYLTHRHLYLYLYCIVLLCLE